MFMARGSRTSCAPRGGPYVRHVHVMCTRVRVAMLERRTSFVGTGRSVANCSETCKVPTESVAIVKLVAPPVEVDGRRRDTEATRGGEAASTHAEQKGLILQKVLN